MANLYLDRLKGIHDASHLVGMPRTVCNACNRSCKSYCQHCAVALDHQPPTVTLPIPLDIYRHPYEREGKSTSTHAKIVAPHHTDLFVSDFKDTDGWTETLRLRYPQPSRVLVLFPSANAVPVRSLDVTQFDRLVVFDGTWRQAKQMTTAFQEAASKASNESFVHVKLEDHETVFWRFQSFSKSYMATIEAIYWCYRELCAESYDSQLDNLLFYFKHHWLVIQDFYKQRKGKQFTARHIDGPSYIQYEL